MAKSSRVRVQERAVCDSAVSARCTNRERGETIATLVADRRPGLSATAVRGQPGGSGAPGVPAGRRRADSLLAVSLPFFKPTDDPGPDFAALVRRAGLAPSLPAVPVGAPLEVTHATTCV